MLKVGKQYVVYIPNEKRSDQPPGGRVGSILVFCLCGPGFDPQLGRWIRIADETQPGGNSCPVLPRFLADASFTRRLHHLNNYVITENPISKDEISS
ncbi:unnamed protein product [Echinostoma caproni]|uniref:Type II toxin-antitoxin system PemK/MazF family toxin n=1 Tax=Echinostoma caproni TaxID=27848 RepID=A0A183BDD2_9TREM|nr:unnamed protein product [Echinostoma caproni]